VENENFGLDELDFLEELGGIMVGGFFMGLGLIGLMGLIRLIETIEFIEIIESIEIIVVGGVWGCGGIYNIRYNIYNKEFVY
jgi:hypothetical protein